MASKTSVSTVLKKAAKVVDVWDANPDFVLGTVNLDSFKASIEAVKAAGATVETKRTELTGLLNDRDNQAATLNDLVTRARSNVRGTFGLDSTQYEQVGGIRRSERKAPKRKAKVVTT
jgi:hypothetical protein